ncbi:MAG: hypothetical protein M0R66_00380 [Candidatus Omnitrophica bacterium]|jgi:hypothetical protein|nr:hypothetical protein [Candidatus Omnitrophota bacterium]
MTTTASKESEIAIAPEVARDGAPPASGPSATPPVVALSGKIAHIICEDGTAFDVPIEAARISKVVKHMIEDIAPGDAPTIPIAAEPSRYVRIAFEYCAELARHRDEWTDWSRLAESRVLDWQREFIMPYYDSIEDLFHLLRVGTFLDISQLVDLSAYISAERMRCKTYLELREMLHITDTGFTPEQEAAIKVEQDNLFKTA